MKEIHFCNVFIVTVSSTPVLRADERLEKCENFRTKNTDIARG